MWRGVHARVHKENSGRWRPCTWLLRAPGAPATSCHCKPSTDHLPRCNCTCPPHPHLPPAVRRLLSRFTRPKIRYSVGGGKSGSGVDRRSWERATHWESLSVEQDGWESWLGEGWLVEESGGVARYGRVRWRVLRPEPSTVDVGVVTRGSLPSSREAFHPSTSTAAAAAACPGKASGDILRQYSQPTITGSRIICIHHRIAGFCHR